MFPEFVDTIHEMIAVGQSIIYGKWPQFSGHHQLPFHRFSSSSLQDLPRLDQRRFSYPFSLSEQVPRKVHVQVLSPKTNSPPLELLDSWDDEYDGIIINPESLPSSTNAFASALSASLSNWKQKGKKRVWLKMTTEQADLVPIAIQEGFNYHHAEPGYVMLTYWIPEEPCTLPTSPSHRIGIAAFVIDDQKQSEEIFSGAIREVKEETGVETTFMELVAFRHAQLVAFEESDLMFVCLLKPLSFEINIDHKDILEAKWITVEELVGQPFYLEDQMSKRVIEICMEAYEAHYKGFTAPQLTSKFDGNKSYLYYKQLNHTSDYLDYTDDDGEICISQY